MEQAGRLRVALADTPDALNLVAAEVQDATGLMAQADFQEIELRGELVVELRIGDPGGCAPSDLATLVAEGAPHLDVLSTWSEPAGAAVRRPQRCHQVLDLLHCEVPDLAVRAQRDGVPTARWHHPSSTQTPHWLLAVPGVDAEKRAVVGVSRRAGYLYRFSAYEASRMADWLIDAQVCV